MKRHSLFVLFPLALTGWLSACGGGTSPNNSGLQGTTLAEQIKALEDSGYLKATRASHDLPLLAVLEMPCVRRHDLYLSDLCRRHIAQ